MILEAKQNEYKTLTELWENSIRATHTFLKEADINFFRPKILNEYLYAVKLYVYKDEFENILGFIGIDENKVEMLFIEPKYFKKGIGKKLMEFTIKTHKIDEVDVNEQNLNAINFYIHLGFEVVNRSETDSLGKPFPILHLRLKK